jgi:hypothetical protein
MLLFEVGAGKAFGKERPTEPLTRGVAPGNPQYFTRKV